MYGRGSGPPRAKIMIVGEAWGAQEEIKGIPFVGAGGDELNRMLHDAGIMRSECFVTNLVNARPLHNRIESWIPKKKKDVTAKHVLFRGKAVDPIIVKGFEALLGEITLVRPNIIIALGGTSLWALTGLTGGILRWRGSQLWADNPRIKLIPTIHPAAVLREYAYRKAVVSDLKRVARERLNEGEYSNIPAWSFITRPSFSVVMDQLQILLLRLDAEEGLWVDFDYETRAGHIDCAGISWSNTEALSIPFMSRERREGYWSLEQEVEIVYRLYQLLCHPKCFVRGQNLLYDCQYSYRHWCFIPNVKQDTMIAHHSAFCGLKKSLDYQASLYCDYYVQWKPDRSAWKAGG